MSKPSRAASGASSTELAVSLETAHEDLVAAEAGVAAAEAAYQAALPDQPAPALRRLKDAREDATIAVDRATSIIARLERQLETTIASEVEAERATRYERAKAMSEAAQKRLAVEYPRDAGNIRDLIRAVAESDIEVEKANADRPEGAPPLPRAEDGRSLPSHRREETSRRRVELWSGIGDHDPLPLDAQRRVVANGRHASLRTEGGSLEVVKRQFDEVTYLPETRDRSVASLYWSVVLPGFAYGEDFFWRPVDTPSPAYVLARCDEPRRPAQVDKPREPEVEYFGVRD